MSRTSKALWYAAKAKGKWDLRKTCINSIHSPLFISRSPGPLLLVMSENADTMEVIQQNVGCDRGRWSIANTTLSTWIQLEFIG